MLRRLSALSGCLLLVTFGLAACDKGPVEEEVTQAAAEEDWSWLENAKRDLDAKRARAAEIGERLESAVEGAAEATEEEVAELQAEAEAVAGEIEQDAATLSERLIGFINSQEIEVGEELTERQRQAFRMKSSEDAVIAREYIDRGGDYARAIEIYNTALELDPGNNELEEALAWAVDHRYVTEERFAQVKKGMTRREVRGVVGAVNLRNVEEYPDGKLGWFYPREDRSAAGVWFEKKKDGVYKVYRMDFNAVKAPS